MAPAATPTRYRFDRFELQLDERRLLRESQPVPLGPLAFDVLATLVGRAGHLVTKHELQQRVWGRVVVEENTLQVHISALRKVLGAAAIATVVSQGYRFTLETSPVQPAPAPQAAPRHNLPQAVSSFIGREAEIGAVLELLRETRLLTLTGAGGCGKTRLALQVAEALRPAYADGVWVVELAPLADPGLLVQAVITALAMQEQTGSDLDAGLLEWLGPRRLLLVLDNTEHLLEASARLADRLLQRCPGLQILATSRERLNVDGELTYRVPSLSLPRSAAEDDVLGCEAARLFIERARLQRHDFSLGPNDAEALASICHRLNGIALAIELAAPRVRTMSLQALAARLLERFDLLTGGSRAALPRQRTLASLIDWSHELLTAEERTLLRRASVFAGGWTIGTAEQVCSGGNIAADEVLGLLTALVEKNLVIADVQEDDTRFGMLETVRDYAQQRLHDSGEEATLRDRHAQWLRDLARQLDRSREAAMPPILRQLEAEHANLRAALAWCESSPARALEGLLMAGLLEAFWDVHNLESEARGWLLRLFAVAPAEAQGAAHALAWQTLGGMMVRQRSGLAALAPLERAVALWRQVGDNARLGTALCDLAEVWRLECNAEKLRGLVDEVLHIAQATGSQLLRMKGLLFQSVLAMFAKQHGDAQALLEACLPIGRSIGATHTTAAVLLRLGRVRNELGDIAGAHAAWSECEALLRGFRARSGLYFIHINLMMTSQDLGDLAAARQHIWASLRYQPDAEPERLYWIENFAGLAKDLAAQLLAARLWGCLDREPEKNNVKPFKKRLQRMRAAAREALNDDAAFDCAWNEGRSWTFEEAMRQAHALEEQLRLRDSLAASDAAASAQT